MGHGRHRENAMWKLDLCCHSPGKLTMASKAPESRGEIVEQIVPRRPLKEANCPNTGLPRFIALCFLALHRCCVSYKLKATPPTCWLALLRYALYSSGLEPNPQHLWGMSVDLWKFANLDFGLLASKTVRRYLSHPVGGTLLWQSWQSNTRVLTRIVVMRQRDCCFGLVLGEGKSKPKLKD